MTRRTFARRTHLEATAEEVFRWHARPGAFERLNPPWDPAVVESRSGGIEDEGARVVLRVGPLRQRWVAEHHGAVPGPRVPRPAGLGALRPVGARAPPRAGGPDACTLEDRIEYALPAGPVGELVGGLAVRAFSTDVRVPAPRDGGRPRRPRRVPRGKAHEGGDQRRERPPRRRARAVPDHRRPRGRAPRARPPRAQDESAGTQRRGDRRGRAEGVDAVVHLAGENIAEGRWTEARKAEM